MHSHFHDILEILGDLFEVDTSKVSLNTSLVKDLHFDQEQINNLSAAIDQKSGVDLGNDLEQLSAPLITLCRHIESTLTLQEDC